jgi:hypothetical protein
MEEDQLISKQIIHYEADRYLKDYPNRSVYNISEYVWSDYTNIPKEYQRHVLATKIINRIKYLKRREK